MSGAAAPQGAGAAPGRLYGVGLGPGDPELMTLRAHRLVSQARIVAYPSLEGTPSFARSIAAALIPADAREIEIAVPMTTERGPAQKAYDAAAAEIAAALDSGSDVVCLCEGDPFLYGSFMYLFARLRGSHEVETVPGVSSVAACAARAGLPLAARNEGLAVLAGPLPDAELRRRILDADSVAIMKVGRHLERIRRIVEGLGLADQAFYIERASLPEEIARPLAEAPAHAPYFSMILLVKGADPWL